MAETGNKITITLDAFDMFNLLGTLAVLKDLKMLPPDVTKSYDKMEINVLMNTTHEAGEEAIAELRAKQLLQTLFGTND